MLYVITWFLVLSLLAIWSGCVWLGHSLVVWSLASIGAMAGQSQQIERLPVPQWVEIWIPPEMVLAFKTSLEAVLPWLESVIAALPSLGNWLAPLAWVVWGIGFVLLALGAVALHALIAMARKSGSREQVA